MNDGSTQISPPTPFQEEGRCGSLVTVQKQGRTLDRSSLRANKVFTQWLDSFKLVLLIFVILSFSTDIRVSSTISIDPDARPTFQLFEFFTLPLLGLLIVNLFIESKRILLLKREDIPYLLFILWAISISIFAFDTFHALSRAKDFFMAWILFVSTRNLNASHVRKVLIFVLFVAIVWSIFGAMQMLELDPWFGSDLGKLFKVAVSWKTVVNPITGEMKDTAFAQGIYLYPQNYTYYVLIPLFVFGGMATKRKRWIPMFLLTLIAMIGSGSKTFYIMVFLWLLWLFFKKFKFNNLLATIASMLVVFGGGVIGILLLNWDHVLSTIGNLVWRIEQWSDTTNMLLVNPVVIFTGHGTEYLEQIYSRFQYPNPHNAFLYFLIEYGIVGLSLFAYFVVSVLKKSKENLSPWPSLSQAYQWYSSLDVFLFRGLLFALAMTLLDDFFVQTQLAAMFMFFLGMLQSLSRAQPSFE